MISQSQKFPKPEKLKSQKAIDELFTNGKTIQELPIKAIYKKKSIVSNITLSVGVSVPKKLIKLAVDRNLLKRRIREAYRLNNLNLKQTLINKETQLNIMFVYNSKQISSFHDIEDKIKVILTRLISLFEKHVE